MPDTIPSDPEHDDEPGEAATLLQLDPTRLCDAIRRLQASPVLAELRQGLAALRQQIHDPAGPFSSADEAHAVQFEASYIDEQISQIGAALSLERARYYLERLHKSVRGIRTSPLNDIDLNRWKSKVYEDVLTDSLWLFDRRDNSGVHKAGYWGNFVPQIPYQLMRRYTKPGEWVLDTFAGSGTTLIEAQRRGRNCIGIELQPAVAAQARQLIAAEPNPHAVTTAIYEDDSATADYRAMLRVHGRETVQLVVMHPPYHDIIRFSSDPRDLSNADSAEHFLAGMGQVLERAAAVLDRGRYLALVIGDKYARGEWVPLGFRAMQVALAGPFRLKSIVVKNFEDTTGKRAQKELWKYRALVGGFYLFKHEYIFVLQRR